MALISALVLSQKTYVQQIIIQNARELLSAKTGKTVKMVKHAPEVEIVTQTKSV